MEKRELSYTVGGNVNWYSHFGEQYGGSSKKLIMELPYDPAIPLLDIYSGKKKKPTNSQRYVHPNVDSNTIYK